MKFIWLPLVLRGFPAGVRGTISYNENDRSSPALCELQYFPEASFPLFSAVSALSCTRSCVDSAELVIHLSARSEDFRSLI